MVDGVKGKSLGLLMALVAAAITAALLMDGAQGAPLETRREQGASPKDAPSKPAGWWWSPHPYLRPPPDSHPMDPVEQSPTKAAEDDLRGWLRDLADDRIYNNASTAFWHLAEHMEQAEPLLLDLLHSGDPQQRLLAAGLIQRYRLSLPTDEPPLDFLPLCWDLVGTRGDPIMLHRAHDMAVRYLARHAKEAAPMVLYAGGLQDKNAARRLIAAWLIARGGGKHPLPRIAEILIHHLEDNHTEGDAVMAANGLHCMGRRVLPHLKKAKKSADPQALQLLNLIETGILNPPVSQTELESHSRLHAATHIYHNPALEYDPLRSRIPLPWAND